MVLYTALKHTHMTCMALSLLGFLWRGQLMLRGASALQGRFWRIAPHVIDSLLLASALALAVFLGQYPFVHAWLTVKVLALLAYIGLGTVALKRGRNLQIRAVCFVLALLVFGFIVSVALTHHPAGIFSRL